MINIVFIMQCHIRFINSFRYQLMKRIIHTDNYRSAVRSLQSKLILYNTISTINSDGSINTDSSSIDASASNSNSKKSKKPSKKGTTTNDPTTTATDSITMEEIKLVRLTKIQTMKDAGINPFAYIYDQTHKAMELQKAYMDLSNGTEDSSAIVSIAGRIMTRRVFGKLAFFTLQDDSGVIQLYLDKGRMVDDTFNTINAYSDAGDIIGVKGTMKRTDKVGKKVIAIVSLS